VTTLLTNATESVFGVATIHTITPADVVELTGQRKGWPPETTSVALARLEDSPEAAAEYLRSIGEEKAANAVLDAAQSVSRRNERASGIREDFAAATAKSVRDIGKAGQNVVQQVSDNKRFLLLGALGIAAFAFYSRR